MSTLQLARSGSITLLATCLLFLSGCSDTRSETDGEVELDSKSQETDTERCRKKLAAAVQRVVPEALLLQDRPERAINGMNAWIASCAAEEMDDLELPEAAAALIGESARATARRFTVNDAAYIRDCMLLRDLTDSVSERSEMSDSESAGNDVARVSAIFDWVIRNVSLLHVGEKRLPLSLFDVLMTGRGTAEDRTWILAECLRQQQIDAIMVRTEKPPVTGGSLDSSESLVVVLLDDSSMVFDMQLGAPVFGTEPENETSAIPIDVATLITHDRWKESTCLVVAQVSAFAPRMLVLQEQLAAEDSAILFEELTGGLSEILPMLERIANGTSGVYSAENVSIWDYPESRVVAANSLSEAERLEYTLLMRPFGGPFQRKDFETESVEELTTVPEELSSEERERLVQDRLTRDFLRAYGASDELYGTPSQGLRKARLQQILGDQNTSVIQQYQQVVIASMEEEIRLRVPSQIQAQFNGRRVISFPFPEIVKEVNQSSTGDSLYWSAMCQMDRTEFGTAINTMKKYRRQYPEGKWKYPSLMNQAQCLLLQKRKDDAISTLKEALQDDNPERAHVALLLQRLTE